MDHVRRFLVLLLAGFAYPARAECPLDRRMVYEPTSGKTGFRMELVTGTTDGIGRALVYRPFSQAPDDYKLITEQTSAASARYVLIGQAGICAWRPAPTARPCSKRTGRCPRAGAWRLVDQQPSIGRNT
jgi:hypothetical protein